MTTNFLGDGNTSESNPAKARVRAKLGKQGGDRLVTPTGPEVFRPLFLFWAIFNETFTRRFSIRFREGIAAGLDFQSAFGAAHADSLPAAVNIATRGTERSFGDFFGSSLGGNVDTFTATFTQRFAFSFPEVFHLKFDPELPSFQDGPDGRNRFAAKLLESYHSAMFKSTGEGFVAGLSAVRPGQAASQFETFFSNIDEGYDQAPCT